MKAYLGIDNGVSGSIAFIYDDYVCFEPVPTKREQSYTKKKAQITRIDWMQMDAIFEAYAKRTYNIMVFIERPFVNPEGFKATVSALRALESVLITVERFGFAYEYVDSKQWQREMLPKGIKGTADLKMASKDIGIRLFPKLTGLIQKHKDADSLLMAEWARRNKL